MAFRVVRLDSPSGGVMTVVATFAERASAEQCVRALERQLHGEVYAVREVPFEAPEESRR